MNAKKNILTINAGSTSIKFAIYNVDNSIVEIVSGSINHIGTIDSKFQFRNTILNEETTIVIDLPDFNFAATYLIHWLEKQECFKQVNVIGHRLVHGMQHQKAEKINSELITELKQIIPFCPQHLPQEILLIELFTKYNPKLIQIACFDTSFHSTLPMMAKLLAIPRRYFSKGIQRYGFHGLSYQYIMQELEIIEPYSIIPEKIILAHLGNGASVAAVNNGQSVDTSMGFTPSSGLVMGTRSGDTDPGLISYLLEVEKLSTIQLSEILNNQSGLIGISETSSDMREIINQKDTDTRAEDAFTVFCYQAKKYLGACTAVLGGLDLVVFTGGIGENSPEVRTQICKGLDFLGIELDEKKNGKNAAIISTEKSRVIVRVIKTNEQIMMAKIVCQEMGYSIKN
jgi:acetate kinase